MHNDELLAQAKAVLTANDRGNFTIPAEKLYPHQWLWDSCFVAIGQRHYDVERAKLELLSLLRAQWKNGMVPHIIFTPGKPQAMHEGIWQSWLSPLSPDGISTSGITQPPMIAEAVVRIGEKLTKTERRSWYRQVWPALLAYHAWIYGERDPHGEGLALLIHPWETGMDNTPPWMAELSQHLLPWWIRLLQRTRLDGTVSIFRSDTRTVSAAERMSNIDALALYDTQLRLRRKAYDIDRILDHSLFAIEDLLFNSVLIRANVHLHAIATALHEEVPLELRKRMKLTEQTLEELWDPYTEQYYSRDFVTHRLLKEPSVAALLPLYAGTVSAERAKLLVKALEHEHSFGTPFPAPSTPASSPWFNPICYWQGPSWVNINWLVIDGLERYGFGTHATALRESTLEMVGSSGCREYFNPLTGEGLGVDNFSWTAALTIDLLQDA
ncbi:MAG TPA: trehalase family glycosidase [Candidatus Saccharimonadales bacterium]|nr:trehalase family glycosidase [Candidatus Saccharimonadales bacterium]